MLIELTVSALMVLATVAIHGFGLAALVRLLRLEAHEHPERKLVSFSRRGVIAMLAIVLWLFALHGIEIWLYAGLYHGLGAVPDFRTAVYFSTATYGAIGYDDSPIAESWRLVAAIEGVNGVILIGWTTAFFVGVIANLGRHRAS